MEMRPLDSAVLDDWLEFFERRAFADHPDWGGCFCQAYRDDRPEWETAASAADNRVAAIEEATLGEPGGLVAYLDGVAVGWVRAGRKTSMPNLMNWEDVVSDDDATIGSIVCFIVDPNHRGQGIASALLEAACDHLAALGMTIAEGYPPTNPTDDARSFPGPLPLYLHHGFTPVGTEKRRTIVRRSLVSEPER